MCNPCPREQMPTPASTPDAHILQATGLRFQWGSSPLFSNLDVVLVPGLHLVCGEEQSGKTTLLRLLAGELDGIEGHVSLQGCDLCSSPSAYRKMVFRTDPQDVSRDAISASAWFQTLPAVWPAFDLLRTEQLADGFALTPHLEKPMYMLSAGSKRKVWLTAAFSAQTPLTLLDQPFAALDLPSVRFLTGLLKEAASHPSRACVIADYEAPADVPLAGVVAL